MSMAAGRLAEVLRRENAALAALDFRGAGAMLGEKTAALAALAADPGGAAGAARDLAVLVDENRTLLERAMLVQGRVLGVIARAAPRALPGAAAGYGRTGARAWGQAPAVAMSARV